MHAWRVARRDAIPDRACCQRPTRDTGALGEDGEPAIEAFVYLDDDLRVAVAVRARQELEGVRPERDGVVVTDDATVFEAEDGLRVEPSGPRAIRRRRIRRRLGKARIVAGQEVRQEGVGALAIGDPSQAQFRPQAVLEGTKEALDAPFGLGAAGGYPLDAQFLECAFDLCGRGFSHQLLLERERACCGPVEDAMAIAVDRDRDAFGLRERVQDLKIAVGVFLLPKRGSQDLAGRIIDRGDEGKARAPLLEPVVVTAIELDQQAGLGHALAASAMPGRATPSRAAQSGVPEDAVDGGLGKHEAFAFS